MDDFSYLILFKALDETFLPRPSQPLVRLIQPYCGYWEVAEEKSAMAHWTANNGIIALQPLTTGNSVDADFLIVASDWRLKSACLVNYFVELIAYNKIRSPFKASGVSLAVNDAHQFE